MPEMVSLQTFELRSLTGHTRSVKARIPIDIPAVMVEEAMARGMVPVHEAGIPLTHSRNPAPKSEIPTGADREMAIMRKIEAFVSRSKSGETGLFTGSGAPNAKVIGQELGFQISTKERNIAWDRFRREGIPEAPVVLTIEEIKKTSRRGGHSSDGNMAEATRQPARTDTEEMSLDDVLAQTGGEDKTETSFTAPSDEE